MQSVAPADGNKYRFTFNLNANKSNGKWATNIFCECTRTSPKPISPPSNDTWWPKAACSADETMPWAKIIWVPNAHLFWAHIHDGGNAFVARPHIRYQPICISTFLLLSCCANTIFNKIHTFPCCRALCALRVSNDYVRAPSANLFQDLVTYYSVSTSLAANLVCLLSSVNVSIKCSLSYFRYVLLSTSAEGSSRINGRKHKVR